MDALIKLKTRDFINYEEFKTIESSKHKSCIDPASMLQAGFKSYFENENIKICENETCIYVGRKQDINISKIKLIYSHKKPLILEIEGKNYKEETCMVLKNQVALDLYCNF